MANSELNALTAAAADTGGIYYGEQSGVSRKFTVTAAGAALLEDANAAAQRTTLGLAIGTNVQAYDADLSLVNVHGADVASASTIDLDAATGDLVDVTGTTTITAVTLADGKQRLVRFTGALTLTHGASLVLPTGANITTKAGDYALFVGYAAGVVRVVMLPLMSTGGNGATDAGKLGVFNSTGGMSFGKSDANASVVVDSNGTTSIIKANAYGGSGTGFDVTTHGINNYQCYAVHAAGTGIQGSNFDFTNSAGNNVGFGVDFSLSVGSCTGLSCDFSGAGSGNVGINIYMDGTGYLLKLDGGVYSINGSGVHNFLSTTPAANATAITVGNATHTTSHPVFDAAQTWNAGGVAFTGIKLNVTNTASSASSLLMDLQVGGTSKFSVNYLGTVTTPSVTSAAGLTLTPASGSALILGDSNTAYVVEKCAAGTGVGWFIEVGGSNRINMGGAGSNILSFNQSDAGVLGWPATGGAWPTLSLGLSQGAANVLYVGTGAQGSFAGSLKVTNIEAVGNITLASGSNFILDAAGSGTKIGTATTQKLGFYNATPIVQGASVADASGGAVVDAEARTAINALISRIEATGLIATV